MPDHVAEALRERAAAHHRSLQGELLALLHEAAASTTRIGAPAALERARALRLRKAPQSVDGVRRDREARSRR